MTKILQRYYVKCPYHLAEQFFPQALSEMVGGGTSGTLTLRAPVRVASVEQSLEKQVNVTLGEGEDAMHLEHPWTVHWTPAGGGPFPDFDGTVTVRADEDYDTCILELQGAYKPPGGAAGAAFDAVAGSRIASATARELLRRVGARLVEHYAANEAGKR